MAVLLIADVNEGALATDAVAKTLAAIASLGEVHVLVAGTGGDAAAAEAAKLSGVSKVLFADDHAYCHGMAESTAALVVSLAGGYSHICGAATAFNKNVLPRVAA
ncbi:MAG: electron transfer flavoprotein subunit alpha/FixB family protein, partial [Cypionkella sp.]|nr:electron transfer flavoprotein subunit alpha/FixB family protein [Cypionkella sp.]